MWMRKVVAALRALARRLRFRTGQSTSRSRASTMNSPSECPPPKTGGLSESSEPEVGIERRTSMWERRETGGTPSEIGGRRGRQPQNPGSGRQRSLSSRPELACRKVPASPTWEVILSADEEDPLVSVKLEGAPLELTDLECRIPSLTGRLTAWCQHGRKHDILLFDGNPLVFKLRTNWTGEGRRTSGITSGYFIVIAPDRWERRSRAPIEPDGCTDATFRAHYFYRDGTPSDDDVDGLLEWNILPFSGIELTGQRIFDDSTEGDLFVGNVPNLASSPDVEWARVGKEGETGWKGENFNPATRSLSEVLSGREGYFFLRVYDSQASLLDSVHFRYLRRLSEIRVNGVRYTKDTVLVPQPT